MLAPHWLDEVFKNPKKLQDDFVNCPRFKKAIQNAAKAFQETQEDMKAELGFYGPTPEQAARVAFLETLNDPK
jgi:hypothetical protein